MNPRVFLEVNRLSVGERVAISGEDGHHLARVLRVEPSEAVALGAGERGYLAEVESVDAKAGTVMVRVQTELPSHEAEVSVYLLQGLPKAEKTESIIQHGTELGISGFLLYQSARAVARLDGKDAKKQSAKLVRWERVIREAAGQSQRDVVPSLAYARTWSELETWLRTVAPGLVLLLDEEEQAEALAAALRSYAARESLEQDSTAKDGAAGKDRPEKGAADQDGTDKDRLDKDRLDKDRLDKDRPDKDSADTKTNAWPRPVVVCVGPEGGWDDSERQSFVQRVGAVPVTLGPRILRTETAGLVGATAVFYHFHALGG